MRKKLSSLSATWIPYITLIAIALLLLPTEAFASGALSGGGGAGLPYEEGVGVIWRSISEFVAPIAVALGVIVGIILFARGSAGSAIYSLFGFAMIGGIALGITEIFGVFGWDGATVNGQHAVEQAHSSKLEN